MSLLLDALNRASLDKAALAAAAREKSSTPDKLAEKKGPIPPSDTVDMPADPAELSFDSDAPPAWLSQALSTLKTEPDSTTAAHLPAMAASAESLPPAMSVPGEVQVDLSLAPKLQDPKPPSPPEFANLAHTTPIPDLVPLAAPQADTLTAAPQADTLTAAPQADTPAAAPQADTLTAAPQADTSAAAPTEASIARTAMPEAPDARPALMPSHGSRVAQNIFRAKQPANNKSRTRVIVLAGVAVALVLATAVGGIFLGVLGDPRMLAQNMDLAVPPSLALPPVSLTAPVPEAEPTASPDARGTSASDTATAPPVANAARPTSRAAVPVGSSGHKPSRPSIPPVKPASSLACPPGTLPPDCKSNVKIRSSGPSILELGYSALTQELLPEAEKFYLRALDNNPEERDALLGLAYIAHKQGRQDDALRHYRRVLRQEPGNVVARAGLLALNSLSDPQDFVSQSRVLAEQNPASAAAQATLGHALVRQDRLADAQLAFSRALQLEPGVARHAFNLAVALDRLHDYEAAQRYYERAVALLAQSGGERANGFALADVQLRLAQLRSAE